MRANRDNIDPGEIPYLGPSIAVLSLLLLLKCQVMLSSVAYEYVIDTIAMTFIHLPTLLMSPKNQ